MAKTKPCRYCGGETGVVGTNGKGMGNIVECYNNMCRRRFAEDEHAYDRLLDTIAKENEEINGRTKVK